MNRMPVNIVVTPPFQPLNEDQKDRIRRAAGPLACRFVEPDELVAAAAGAEIVACRHGHNLDLLKHNPPPKWVHSWSAGVDELAGPEMTASKALLTCAKSNGAIALGEHVMMLMLMLQRDAIKWIDAQRRNQWSKHIIGELYGKTCGIIGLGYIGKETALRAKAFGMRTLGIKRNKEPVANVDEVFDRRELPKLLGQSDFVVVTAPHTPETENLIDAAALRAMKRTAFLILVSRGGIVNEADLLAALKAGHIAGAGLDDFVTEPLPSSSPLWTAPNTIITPHNGPTSLETSDRGVDIFVDNLERWQAGKPLRNIVDLVAGY